MKRKTDNFSKFYTKKNNAAIKESFRQEKKAAKKERKEAIERHFEEKRKARAAQELQRSKPEILRPVRGGAPGKPASKATSPKAAGSQPAAATAKGGAPQAPN